MDLIVQYVSVLKIPTSDIKTIVRELSWYKNDSSIWGFVTANCVNEIRDMQEKICCMQVELDLTILDTTRRHDTNTTRKNN